MRLPESEKARAQYCRVHRKRLQVGIVPVRYGLVVVAEVPNKAFPNSNWLYDGGCVADCYKQAEVLYCPACRKAERQWKEKRGELLK